MLLFAGYVLINVFHYARGYDQCTITPQAVEVFHECWQTYGANISNITTGTLNKKEQELVDKVIIRLLVCYVIQMNFTNEEFVLNDEFLTLFNNSYAIGDQIRKPLMSMASGCQHLYDNRTSDGTWAVLNCIILERIPICETTKFSGAHNN